MTSTFFPSIFRESIVRITIQPLLAWLGRRDHRMAAHTCVVAGVLIKRVVATQRPAALLTCPQMHPSRADLYALSALAASGMLDRRDCGKMSAGSLRHQFTFSLKLAICSLNFGNAIAFRSWPAILPTLNPPRSTLNLLPVSVRFQEIDDEACRSGMAVSAIQVASEREKGQQKNFRKVVD